MAKRYLLLLLFTGVLCQHAGCTKPDSRTQAPGATAPPAALASPPAAPTPEPSAIDAGLSYSFGAHMVLRVNGKDLLITDSKGAVLARNNHILRAKDENGDCPSEGFIDITVKGDSFTVAQQNCSGWQFIDEYITIRHTGEGGGFLLQEFKLFYSDRRDPDKVIPEKVLTEKDFGKQDFSQLNVDSLYALVR